MGTSLPLPARPFAWKLGRGALRAMLGALLLALFAVASVGGLALHLDLPATRRLTTRLVSVGLSRVFAGKFTVGAIGTLRPDRVELSDLSVFDLQGRQVLRVTGLRAHADLWALGWRILRAGSQPLVIDHVRGERVECQVIPDPKTSIPTLAEAFSLRLSPGAQPPSAAPIEVRLPSIEIGKAAGQARFVNLPLLDAEVTRAKGSVIVRPGLTEIDVERFGAALRGIGGAVAQGTATLHISVPGAVSGSFEGRVGDVEVAAKVRSEGRKLLAELSLPGAEADALRVLWPAWPAQERLGARLVAQGTLPVLEASTELDAGRTKVTARGPVRLAGDVGAHLGLTAKHLDLGKLVSGAPSTDLEGAGSITFLVRDGRAAADFQAATRATVVAGQPVPAVDLTGHYGPQGLSSELTLHEPGVPLKAEVTLAPDGSLQVTAKAERFRLGQSPRFRALSPADGEVDVEAQVHLDRSQLEASAVSNFRGLSWGPIHAGQGRLTARFRGEISKLETGTLEAALESSDVTAGLFSLTRVDIEARGPVSHPELRARVADARGLGLTFTGRASASERRLDNLVVNVSRAGASLEGKVKRLDLAGGAVEVSDLELTGAGGHLTGSLRLRPDLAEIQAEGTDLDLDLASRVLGLPAGLLGGKARVTADVSVGTDVSRGRLRVSVKDGSIAYRRGIDWDLAADLAKEHLEASSQINVKDVGEFEARVNAELAGSPLRLVAWRRAVGQAAVYVNRLDLAALHQLPGATGTALGEVTGQVAGWVNIERRDPSSWPNAVVKLGSQGLTWVYGGQPDQPKRLEGIELELGASLEGQTGRCQLAARAVDLKGTLAAATLQTELDLAWLAAHPRDFEQKLTETPVKAVLDVPERALGDFPEPLRVAGVTGRVGGRLDLEGKPEDPTVSATVSARELRVEKSRFELPVDVDLAVQYQSTTGRFTGNAEVAQAGSRVAVLGWQADVPWQNVWLGTEPGQPSWRGTAELSLFSLPVATIPTLADARVGGKLKGTVKFQRQGLLPTAQAELELAQATVGNVSLGAGTLGLEASNDLVRAKTTLTKDGGRLESSLVAGLAWTNDFVALDTKRPIEIELHAHALDAGVLGPLTADVLTHVSGKLDGDLKLELVPVAASEHPDQVAFATRLTGNAELNDGSLGLAGLGLELRRVSASGRATTSGDTTKIELRDVAGSARSSQTNVKGWANLELVQGRVTAGQGALSVNQVPLPVEGVSMATIQGSATLGLERTPEAMVVSVNVPELVAKLPLSSTRSVISLSDNPNITVAQPLGEPREAGSGTALPWVISFDLGSAVRIERGDVYLPVSGKPRLRLGAKTELDGYVDLEPGGRLPAVGKVFQVETGRVWFDSTEPSNPNIAVTASWRGPDATVYVDIRGRWRNAKLSLRSEPPRPESEILLVLLQGGSPEEAEVAAAKGQAFVGATTAANALGVSDLFSGTPLGGLQLRADTSQGSGSYAATFRLSDRVWVEGIYRPQGGVGQSGVTSQNDTSQMQRQDSYAGAVDLRLGHDWTLRTEGGNASAAVDLLWQYRY